MSRRVVTLVNQGLTYLDPVYRDTTSIILDNNEFRNLGCLDFLHDLQQLSIANNRICEMQSLSALNNLTILNLAYNEITFIDGLCSLTRLTWLNLSGNRIQRIDGLYNNLSLKHLDLSENKISELGDLSSLRKLKTLLLHCNDISSLDTASHYLPSQVCILSLAENQLDSYAQLAYLAHLESLIQFSIQGNPCALNAQTNHRAYVLSWFPGLQILDGVEPSQEERRLGEWLWNSGASQSFGPTDDDRLSNYLQELDRQPYDERSRPSCTPPRDFHHHAWENQEVQVSGHNQQLYDPVHQQWPSGTQKPIIRARNTGSSRMGMAPENGINRVMHTVNGNSGCPDRQQAYREQSKIPIHASSNSPPQYHRVFGSSSLATSAGSSSFAPTYQTCEAKTLTASASYQQPVFSQLPPVASDRRGPPAAPLPTARQSCLLQSDSVFIPLRESTNSPSSSGSPQLQPTVRKAALAQRSASCALVDCCVSPVLIPASAGSDSATGASRSLLPNMSSSQVVLDDSLSGSDSEDEGAETKTVTFCHRTSSASMQTAFDVTNRRTSDTSDFPLASTSTSVLSLNRNGLSSQHNSANSVAGTSCYPAKQLHNQVSEPPYKQEMSQDHRAEKQVPAAGDCVRSGTAGSTGASEPATANDFVKKATSVKGTPRSQENADSPRTPCPACGCCPDEIRKSVSLLRSQVETLREAVTVETKARQLNAQAMQFLLREVESLKEWKSNVISSGLLSEPPPSYRSHWTPHNGTSDPPANRVGGRTSPGANTPPLPPPPPPPPQEQQAQKPATSTANFSVIGPCKSEGSPSISGLLALNSHLAGFTTCQPDSSVSLAEVSPLLMCTKTTTTTATFGTDGGLRLSGEKAHQENEAACLSPPTPTGTGSSPALRSSADSLDLVLSREEKQVEKQEPEDASLSTSVASKAALFGLMVRMGGAKSDSSLRQKLRLDAGSPPSSVRGPTVADDASDLQRVRLAAIETVNNNSSASLQTDTETSLDFHGP